MDKMTHAGNRVGICKGVSLAGGGISVCTLQDGKRIGETVIALVNETGDTRGIVGCIRLEFPCPQGLFKSFPCLHQIIHGICLVTIGNNGVISQNTHRCIDDKAGVYHLGRVKCLCPDAGTVLYKDTVAAVFTSSHNKVCGDSVVSVFRSAEDNASARIGILLQFLLQ